MDSLKFNKIAAGVLCACLLIMAFIKLGDFLVEPHKISVNSYPIKVENGDIIRLYPGKKPVVYDKAPSGRLYVDGIIPVEEDAKSIKERKNISVNGFIEATILITPKGNIHDRPLLTFKGLPIYKEDEFKYGLEETIEKTIKTFSLNRRNQEENLVEALKIACRKFSKEKTGKKPLTNINLVRI